MRHPTLLGERPPLKSNVLVPGDQTSKRWSALALGLGLAEFLGGLGVVIYIVQVYGHHSDWFQDAVWVFVFIGFPLVGAATASSRPRHPVGWLLLAIGGVGMASQLFFAYSPGPHPSVPQALVLIAAGDFLVDALILLAILILLFPSGSPGRAWRRRAVVAVAVAGLLADINSSFVPQLSGDAGNYPNPLRALGFGGLSSALGAVFDVVALVVFLGTAIDAITRLRRSRGVPRQQLKWLAYASALLVPGVVIAIALPTWWSPILLIVATNALAASVGVAIARYRLYDIDRLISRTLAYATVTGLLIGVYVAFVTLATRILPFSSPVGVAASTLVAVALFNPLRRRIQRLVDRRFNRARYDAAATVAAFAHRVRDDVDLDVVSSEFVQAVRDSVEPAHVSLWLRPSGSGS